MFIEIEPASHDGMPCHECRGSFRKGEPSLHVTVKDPWADKGRGAITVYCFGCYMEFVDEVVAMRTEYANAGEAFESRMEPAPTTSERGERP